MERLILSDKAVKAFEDMPTDVWGDPSRVRGDHRKVV